MKELIILEVFITHVILHLATTGKEWKKNTHVWAQHFFLATRKKVLFCTYGDL